MSAARVIPSLDELAALGFFGPLEVHFARLIARGPDQAKRDEDLLLLGAALAARGPQQGQVCVSLVEPPELLVFDEERRSAGLAPLCWPDSEAWLARISRSPAVGDGSRHTPLVLDGAGRLYLHRYHEYQSRLVSELDQRSRVVEQGLDSGLIKEGIRRLFNGSGDSATRGQQAAAIMTVLRRIAVISGGPGTGKTTTVLKILALLQEQARHLGERFPLEVLLLAPTGKAAARLAESIRHGREKLAVDETIRCSIPSETSTIHRALGFDFRRPTQFKANRDNPLPVDVVIVDESSMVDLALMSKLVDAVPPGSKLILLGDRDQLASVEAGAVLGDICNVGGRGFTWSAAFSAQVASILDQPESSYRSKESVTPPIADCTMHLSTSFRFGSDSGIGALSRAINDGDGARVIELLEDESLPDIEWLQLEEEGFADSRMEQLLGQRLVGGFTEALLEVGEPVRALEAYGRFRVLCAHRRGRFGVAAINELVRARLSRAGVVAARGQWYSGRPILVTRNDPQVGLYNGDVGLTLPDPSRRGLRVYFPADDGQGTRSFHPARLPEHETSYAMTIHKSQGSEFEEVLILLPTLVSPIITRELLYTGVTRARRHVTIVGSRGLIEGAVARRVKRASGLHQALWGE